LGLVQAAKAWALQSGRAFLVPDDLRAVAAPVLAHRMVLTAEAEPDPRARDGIIDEALAKVGYRPNARR
jgi:MoxR-like ATPase